MDIIRNKVNLEITIINALLISLYYFNYTYTTWESVIFFSSA